MGFHLIVASLLGWRAHSIQCAELAFELSKYFGSANTSSFIAEDQSIAHVREAVVSDIDSNPLSDTMTLCELPNLAAAGHATQSGEWRGFNYGAHYSAL
ncbi:hypothetical protein BN2475_580046 [Paraburkholderia ribeironis]|uniref:Uncharacterized protein n=1 Tax=Paraburkholderia ribeironis TaxID=1247936 RepID=A0A1N7SEB6_9BURK|nr:hypothetical protein BN2475_580046 [Paraburkholderia ribeironis]